MIDFVLGSIALILGIIVTPYTRLDPACHILNARDEEIRKSGNLQNLLTGISYSIQDLKLEREHAYPALLSSAAGLRLRE